MVHYVTQIELRNLFMESSKIYRSILTSVRAITFLYLLSYMLTLIASIVKYRIISNHNLMILLKESVGLSMVPWIIPSVFILIFTLLNQERYAINVSSIIFGVLFAFGSVNIVDRSDNGIISWYIVLAALFTVGAATARYAISAQIKKPR